MVLQPLPGIFFFCWKWRNESGKKQGRQKTVRVSILKGHPLRGSDAGLSALREKYSDIRKSM